MRFLILLFVVVLSCSNLFGSQVLDVKNAGFEVDANNDNIPDGWTLTPKKPAHSDIGTLADLTSWHIDGSASHTGNSSVKAGNVSERDDGYWIQRGIVIPSGANCLKVTGWIKSQDVRTSGCIVALTFKDEKGKTIPSMQNVLDVGSNRDWTRYVGYVEVAEGARKVDVSIYVYHAFINCGTFWVDDLEIEVVDKIHKGRTYYKDEKDWPEVSSEEKENGYIVFSRDYTRVLMRNAVPCSDERVGELSMKACAGEYEPITFALFGVEDIKGLKVSVSELKGDNGTIPSGNIDLSSVYYMTRGGQRRWGIFQSTLMDDVPMFLEKRESVNISKGQNQAFWVTVKVPESAVSGRYSGIVTIDSSKGKTEIPVVLEVYPFKLEEAKGIAFGMYAHMRNDDKWIDESLDDLRSHGMTMFTIYGGDGLDIQEQEGRLVINWNGKSTFERYMKAYRQKGFTEPLLWLMNQVIPNRCLKFGEMGSKEFARVYRDLIGQIVEKGKAEGWPEIFYQPIDEPFEHEHNLSIMLQLSALLKSVPGVRTENDGMNGKWSNFTDTAYRLTDVMTLHDGPMLDRHSKVDMEAWWEFTNKAHRDGKLLWYYNIDLTAWHPEAVRYMSGYGLWASRADGIIEWCYMSPYRNGNAAPAYQPYALLYRFPAREDTTGGPTIGFEGVREGIDDYRYLVTLEKVLEKVYGSGDLELIEKADSICKGVFEKLGQATFDCCSGVAAQGNWDGNCELTSNGDAIIRGDFKLDNNLRFEDYGCIRGKIADAIIEINRLLN